MYTTRPFSVTLAEYVIAIISARLPNAAPSWSGKEHRAFDTWFVLQDLLERPWGSKMVQKPPMPNTNNGQDASVRHLLSQGLATDIVADDVWAVRIGYREAFKSTLRSP